MLRIAMPAERAYVPEMPQLMTAEDLLHASVPDKRTELVRGVLVVREPAGGRHGRIAGELFRAIGNYVHDRRLGTVYAAETGFTLARRPDTVRAPDVAFLRRDRVPDPEPVGFPELAPDLAVEVLSPGDRPGETLVKVGDWLSAGTPLVWVIDPERRVARIYRRDGTERIVTAVQTLNGEDVVPGFSLSLAAVL
jgi:Uma2 family endonuclease